MDDTLQPNYTISLDQSQVDDAVWNVERVILNTLDFSDLNQTVCNSLLTELNYLQLGYRIVVLILADKETNTLKRVSISQTDEAKTALALSPVPFSSIDVPMSASENLCVKVYNTKTPQGTNDWKDILVPPLATDQAEKIQQVLGIKHSLVYPLVAKNESLGILIFSLIKDANQVTEEEKKLLSHFTDIVGIGVQNAQLFSHLQQTTQTLSEANIQIGLAGKLKENLLTMASHEFRTPISNIKNMLWMFESQEFLQKLSDKEKQHFARLSKSVERLDYVVNNISQMLRATTGDFEQQLQFDAVQIERIVRQVIEDKDVEARDALVTLKYIEPDNLLPVIEADPIKLQYVIYELITNALKYTPKNGVVTVTTELENNDIVIKIADTGRGIPADNLPTLFQGFDKIDVAHTTQSGMGLGLYIVQKIVTLHKGAISVDSAVDEGTTITIKLPAQKAE